MRKDSSVQGALEKDRTVRIHYLKDGVLNDKMTDRIIVDKTDQIARDDADLYLKYSHRFL